MEEVLEGKTKEGILDDSIIFALAGAMIDVYTLTLLKDQKNLGLTMVSVQHILKLDKTFITRFKAAQAELKARTEKKEIIT